MHDFLFNNFVVDCIFDRAQHVLTSWYIHYPGLVYCMDYLEKNIDWLQSKLKPLIKGKIDWALCTIWLKKDITIIAHRMSNLVPTSCSFISLTLLFTNVVAKYGKFLWYVDGYSKREKIMCPAMLDTTSVSTYKCWVETSIYIKVLTRCSMICHSFDKN